jgi:hypothetical protein
VTAGQSPVASSGRSVKLRVQCEGLTEQNFVTQVLQPHLSQYRVFAQAEPLCRGRSGVVRWEVLYAAIKADVGRSREHEYVTTLLDLYALPDYPGDAKAQGKKGALRAEEIEAAMADALPSPRFIPYIQVHEFEALVFVDLDELPSAFPDGEAEGAPTVLRRDLGDLAPEEINDHPETAPSKRLVRAVPAYKYKKPIVGPQIAARIGLPRLRAACPHFNSWLAKLEKLAAT